METQKIANLLRETNNESSKFSTRNAMLSMIKMIQAMVKEMKIVQPLNLKSKSLKQVFAIIQRMYSCNRRHNSHMW